MARTILDEVLGVPARLHRAPVGPRRQGSQWAGLQPDGVPARAPRHDAGLGRYLDRLRAGEIEPGTAGSEASAVPRSRRSHSSFRRDLCPRPKRAGVSRLGRFWRWRECSGTWRCPTGSPISRNQPHIAKEESALSSNCCRFNDRHVIALARASGAYIPLLKRRRPAGFQGPQARSQTARSPPPDRRIEKRLQGNAVSSCAASAAARTSKDSTDATIVGLRQTG